MVPTELFRVVFKVIHPDKDFDKERSTKHGHDAEHVTYHVRAGADHFVTIDGDIPEECVEKPRLNTDGIFEEMIGDAKPAVCFWPKFLLSNCDSWGSRRTHIPSLQARHRFCFWSRRHAMP